MQECRNKATDAAYEELVNVSALGLMKEYLLSSSPLLSPGVGAVRLATTSRGQAPAMRGTFLILFPHSFHAAIQKVFLTDTAEVGGRERRNNTSCEVTTACG